MQAHWRADHLKIQSHYCCTFSSLQAALLMSSVWKFGFSITSCSPKWHVFQVSDRAEGRQEVPPIMQGLMSFSLVTLAVLKLSPDLTPLDCRGVFFCHPQLTRLTRHIDGKTVNKLATLSGVCFKGRWVKHFLSARVRFLCCLCFKQD